MKGPQLSIIKFQENNIQMINHSNKKIYRYVQPQMFKKLINPELLESQQSCKKQIERQCQKHYLIQELLQLGCGYIYEKQLMTMADAFWQKYRLKQIVKKQAEERYQSEKQVQEEYFSEDQLNNTFDELINYAFSRKQQQYSCFRLENILINQQGNIRLKHPTISQRSYFQSDIQALGYLILQCSTLNITQQNKHTNFNEFVLSLERYSGQFIAKIWIMINQIKQHYCFLQQQCSQNNQNRNYQHLIKEINTIKSSKIRKLDQSEAQVGDQNCQMLGNIKKQSILALPLTASQNSKNTIQQKKNKSSGNKDQKGDRQRRTFRNRKIVVVPPLSLLQKNSTIKNRNNFFSSEKQKQRKTNPKNHNQNAIRIQKIEKRKIQEQRIRKLQLKK